MAIEAGLTTGCVDLQAAGGTRHLLIREWASGDTVAFGATHSITKIVDTGGTDADWGVYESRIESSSLTITGGNDGNNTSTYECVMSFFLPRLHSGKLERLTELEGACLMCIIIDSDSDGNYMQNQVIGVSEKYRNLDDDVRNQTYARLSTIEGGTGAAFSDENGVTVAITCTQYELPRAYIEGTGAGITILTGGITATTT
jgi:hypothetical protein